jgi:antagonist of KipI
MWIYLAMSGGIQAATVLDSRSTYLKGHFGGLDGRTLRAGDVLHGAATSQLMMEAAGQSLAPEVRPRYGEEPTLGILAGPQSDEFSESTWGTLLSSGYSVSSSSDRMGYRLAGPRLEPTGRADLTSEGISIGSVQVPPDGNPIAMMADCATTGGYPKIASVIRADLPLLAQCTPGRDRIRFRLTTIEAAQQRHWELQQGLMSGIVSAQE